MSASNQKRSVRAANRGGPRSRLLVKRLGVALLALVTALALVEVGLRVATWGLRPSRVSPPAGDQTILCLGDSWTAGAGSGDPATRSYPALVQQTLDQRAGTGHYRVVNEGKRGMPLPSIASEIEVKLSRHRPALVLLLGGGLQEHADGKQLVMLGSPPPEWLGPLGRLKVVKLLFFLADRPGSRTDAQLARSLAGLHQQLLKVNQELGANLGDSQCAVRGREQPPTQGCPSLQRLEQLEQARDPQAALKAYQELLGSHPECGAGHLALARIYFSSGDLVQARQHAERAGKLPGSDALAPLLLGRIDLAEAGQWTLPALEKVILTFIPLPNFMEPRLLKLQGEIALNRYKLCTLRTELEESLLVCPKNPWLQRMVKVLQDTMGSRGRLIVNGSYGGELVQNLVTIQTACSRHGATLVLLNYPHAPIDPCRDIAITTIRDFARTRELPYIDLAPVLGPYSGKASRVYIPDGHPTAYGYQLIAAHIIRQLEKQELIEPAP
jgi:lysophospholipase L1-like esterase